MPWEKKEKPDPNTKNSVLTNEAVATVGSLTHYKIKQKHPDSSKSVSGIEQRWEYVNTWAKTFASQTNIMHWSDD